MTARSLPEWIGASPDTAIPDRVKDRIVQRANGCCEECGWLIKLAKDRRFDHRIALINGGLNRESNLQHLCDGCHGNKTGADVAEKATSYRKRKKHLGIHKPKRPFPGSRASEWKREMTTGRMVRREKI